MSELSLRDVSNRLSRLLGWVWSLGRRPAGALLHGWQPAIAAIAVPLHTSESCRTYQSGEECQLEPSCDISVWSEARAPHGGEPLMVRLSGGEPDAGKL